MILFSDMAIQQAREVAKKDQKVITIATSLLRSCEPITSAWKELPVSENHYQIRLVSFEDNPASLKDIMMRLGKDIDLMVGPISVGYLMNKDFEYFNLGNKKYNIAVPITNPLAQKNLLTWKDLKGQTLGLLKKGLSPSLDNLRSEIVENHPEVKIMDLEHFYDIDSFNKCVENNYLVETLDLWENVHPLLKTIEMDWDYTIGYGMLYSSHASQDVKEFVSLVGEQYLKTHAK